MSQLRRSRGHAACTLRLELVGQGPRREQHRLQRTGLPSGTTSAILAAFTAAARRRLDLRGRADDLVALAANLGLHRAAIHPHHPSAGATRERGTWEPSSPSSPSAAPAAIGHGLDRRLVPRGRTARPSLPRCRAGQERLARDEGVLSVDAGGDGDAAGCRHPAPCLPPRWPGEPAQMLIGNSKSLDST